MGGQVERLTREVHMVIGGPDTGPHGSAFGAVTSLREKLGARERLRMALSGSRSPEDVERAMRIIRGVERSSVGGPEDLAVNYRHYLYGSPKK